MKNSLRKTIQTDVFDYLQLTDALSAYGNIRGKIGRLLASGEIIRIKKGLYTFPDYLRRETLNSAVLANMIYGPSYVSCDYALSYYGMIPERVELVASVTMGRPRYFKTPVGNYAYYQRRSADYPVGIDYVNWGETGFLIASPEKAIYDKVFLDKRFTAQDDIGEYLLDDLRMDEDSLHKLDRAVLDALLKNSRGRMARLVRFLLEGTT
ncbi:MAG: hypothetical protein Q4G59_10550 [Planctomycetia bacterium]|nr:hypothetical protein [Planctomycetia bacterium]